LVSQHLARWALADGLHLIPPTHLPAAAHFSPCRFTPFSQVWSVNISPDGLWLTVGGYDARIAVYSLRSLLSRAAQYDGDVAEVAPVQEISFKPETGGQGFIW
jgi:WD40 repeat protein